MEIQFPVNSGYGCGLLSPGPSIRRSSRELVALPTWRSLCFRPLLGAGSFFGRGLRGTFDLWQTRMGEDRKPPQADNNFAAGGMSRRAAAACRKIWSPLHWRDREWRSFARTDPAHRSESAGVYEKVRFATTVGDLQRDVFIERRAVDGLPAVIFPRPHSTFPFRSIQHRSVAGGLLSLSVIYASDFLFC